MIHMSYIFNTYTPCGIRVFPLTLPIYGKTAAVVEETIDRNSVTCPKCLEVTK